MTPEIHQIVEAVRMHQRFVLSSHVRPDGDAIGSQLAMFYALQALGKDVRIINQDPPPESYRALPGVSEIEVASTVDRAFDVAIIMECGDLARTGVAGLARSLVINIDHHPGNTGFGHVNWFEPTAAACGEMVFDLVRALGVPLSTEIGTHVYVAIHTDTGGFHYGNISPRTFDICRQTLEAGVDPVRVARILYDSRNMGRLKLSASVMHAMQLDPTGRIAVLYLDHEIAREASATYEDTEGLINEPLTVKEIQAVVFFKQIDGETYRVSMRSKGAIDVGAVATQFDGGGHKNAAGCTVTGPIDALQKTFVKRIEDAIEEQAEGQEGGKAGGQEGRSGKTQPAAS